MARILKVLGLGLVIATIVWLVTLWQWQQTEREIGMNDIVLQLIILPLLLTAGLLAALWVVERMRVPSAAPQPDKRQADRAAAAESA